MSSLDDALQIAGNLREELLDVGSNAQLDFSVASLVSRAADAAEQAHEFVERAIAIDDSQHPEER